LGGIFPVLLLAATRRKGDFVPGLVLKFLGHPVVLAGLYLVFLGSIFVYGLFIYEGIVERVVTLLVGSVVLVVTIIMLHRGALDTRLVVELRQDMTPKGRHVFNVTAGGQPLTAEVRLGYGDSEQRLRAATGQVPAFDSLRCATFDLPAISARMLKVWVHRLTPEDTSEALSATLIVNCGAETQELDMKQCGGQAVLPLASGSCRVELTL
jgi:hypothetical protein